MKEIINTPYTIETIVGIGFYLLRQIDLRRIKKGKKPIFSIIDLIKLNK
jgi:hypothetical protein